jgi:hypothetical protein
MHLHTIHFTEAGHLKLAALATVSVVGVIVVTAPHA